MPSKVRAALLTPEADRKIEPGVKLPKSLGACADLLYETQQKRYDIQKEIDRLTKLETDIREHLINNLPKSEATGVTGKLATARVVEKEVVELYGTERDRFEKVYSYILANAKKDPGVWSLLQRRVGDAAAKELIAAGKGAKIGARLGKVPAISLTKVK